MQNENNKNIIRNTQNLNKSLVTGLNLVEVSREEIENRRKDFTRFTQPQCYLREEELKYFRDPQLRKLFVKIFYEKEPNVIKILDEALEASGNSFRVLQIRDYVIRIFLKDGRIII